MREITRVEGEKALMPVAAARAMTTVKIDLVMIKNENIAEESVS